MFFLTSPILKISTGGFQNWFYFHSSSYQKKKYLQIEPLFTKSVQIGEIYPAKPVLGAVFEGHIFCSSVVLVSPWYLCTHPKFGKFSFSIHIWHEHWSKYILPRQRLINFFRASLAPHNALFLPRVKYINTQIHKSESTQIPEEPSCLFQFH